MSQGEVMMYNTLFRKPVTEYSCSAYFYILTTLLPAFIGKSGEGWNPLPCSWWDAEPGSSLFRPPFFLSPGLLVSLQSLSHCCWCLTSSTASKTKTGSWLRPRPWILMAKFRLTLKKVGKTTRPFRYDLSQIPYDYTVEVTSRAKRLDLIDRVPEELWTEVHDNLQEAGIKTIPKEKKCKKEKWLSGEPLQIAVKRREVKSKGEKER